MENTFKPISEAVLTLILIKIWKVNIRSLGLLKPAANAKLQGCPMYVFSGKCIPFCVSQSKCSKTTILVNMTKLPNKLSQNSVVRSNNCFIIAHSFVHQDLGGGQLHVTLNLQ